MPPEVRCLLERLLWPAFRIRWEAARQIAALIAEGFPGAREGLLAWISERRLESEAALGVSVIDAFELGAFFLRDEVDAVLRVPSSLSRILLDRTLGQGRSEAEPGFARGPAKVGPHVAAYFHDRMGQAIPLMFHDRFQRLEMLTGRPFLARWEHEWRWLQAHLGEPLSTHPYWFHWSERGSSGYFDLRQREVYVSAYLRALAYAERVWALPADLLDLAAFDALQMNRGLAKLKFATRPRWTRGITIAARSDLESTAREVAAAAARAARAGERLLSARAVDRDGREFVDIRIDAVVSGGDWKLRADEDEEPIRRPWPRLADSGGDFAGGFRSSPAPEPPFALAGAVQPSVHGRLHVDLFPTTLVLAWPGMFKTAVTVRAEPNELSLRKGRRTLSRVKIWNTEWAPTHDEALRSSVGLLSTVSAAELAQFLERSRLELRYLIHARLGTTQHSHDEHRVTVLTTWLDCR
jgi:hypothetical protein